MRDSIRRALTKFTISAGPRSLLESTLLVFDREGLEAAPADAVQEALSNREGRVVSDTSFRKRLSRLNGELREAGAVFEFQSVNGQIRARPNARHDAERASAGLDQELKTFFAEKPASAAGLAVEPRAAPERPGELLVMFSYAWLNRGTVGQQLHSIQDEFFEALSEQLAYPLQAYRDLPMIKLWRDTSRIDPSEQGSPQMDEACRQAFLGLLLMSRRYPHSAACLREAAHFVTDDGKNRPGKACIVVPVNVAPDEVPPKFSAGTRVWRFDDRGRPLAEAWGHATGSEKDRFVAKIAQDIFQSARAYLAAVDSRANALAHQLLSEEAQQGRTVPPRAARTRLITEVAPLGKPSIASKQLGVDIVSVLADWACSGDGPRLTALLGEFGTGKTVTCQLVTRELVKRREQGKSNTLPLYFDLRNLDLNNAGGPGTLERIVGELLHRTGESMLDAKQVIAHIRKTGAIVIFDGIDEVTNRLNADEAIRFYRELLSIVPVEDWQADSDRRRSIRMGEKVVPSPAVGPRILVSCRSHYFRDLTTQRSFLSGQDRAGLTADDDIQAFNMLPFSDYQIRAYLELHLGTLEVRRAVDLIAQIYNLQELAERPILLRFIRESLLMLDNEHRAGSTINLARIYDIFVSQTLARDDPKHIIPVREKRLLLEALAREMHQLCIREMPHEKLTDWFVKEASRFPRLMAALHGLEGLKASEMFLQDLRNTSLIVRPSEGGFRFGHTSILEYFLADDIFKSIYLGVGTTELNIPLPSRETLGFILARFEIAEASDRDEFERNFPALLAPGQPKNVRCFAFALWRNANFRFPRPDVLDVSGLDFLDTAFMGQKSQLVPLHNSRWNGTRLINVEFHHVDISDADFSYAEAGGTRFVSCLSERTIFNRFAPRTDGPSGVGTSSPKPIKDKPSA
jgi:hypothetical protein